MATLPEDMAVAIDELESAITEMESRLESAHAERDEAKARQVELEIENANLRREVALARAQPSAAGADDIREALESQRATADILSVISSSAADAQPVFDKILRSIEHLFGGDERFIYLAGDDGLLHIGAAHGPNAERVRAHYPMPLEGTASEVAFRERRVISYADVFNEPEVPSALREVAQRIGQNYSMALAPMFSEGRPVGSIFVGRTSMRPFSDKECSLLRSFADQAVIAIQNARLFNETREALERQTATADILKVIAASPSDLQLVFDAIARSAKRLAKGHTVVVTRVIDDMVHLAAHAMDNDAGVDELKSSFPAPLSSEGIHSRVARSGQLAFRTDMENEPDLTPAMKEMARARGYRSILVVPMLREGVAIGTISISRREAGSFDDKVTGLLTTFADQAVIAIEDARLIRETQEALERQTATADILKVIASSPSDVQPVFEAIAESANRLFGGFSSAVFRFADGMNHLAAFTSTDPASDQALRASFPRPISGIPHLATIMQGTSIQIADTETADELSRDLGRARGFRSISFTPLINRGTVIGMITVTRREPGAFSDHQVQLVQTFADQAVIAIQNAQSFNETEEALERQTATADILKVIASSPADVQPVFEAIAVSAKHLLGGFSATVLHFIGDELHLAAFTPTNPEADQGLQASFPRRTAEFPIFAMIRDGATIQFPDTEAENVPAMNRDLGRLRGFRSVLFVPLMSRSKPVGILSITRTTPGAFAEHHMQLLQTFADQAVIAIENTRLFNETQEALERQTATADILKVIASSPSDVQPVFEAIAASANRLVGGFSTAVHRFIDDIDHLAAFTPTNPESDAALKAAFPRHISKVPAVAFARNGAQIADSETADASIRELGRARGWRSVTYTPLMNQEKFIGFIACTQREPGVLADHHVQLLRTFADQAVIAIENTRLFNETREALERQTATADILKVIASSPSNVQPVFEAIVGSAATLFEPCAATIVTLKDDKLHWNATAALHPDFDVERARAVYPLPFEPDHILSARAIAERQILEIPDIESSDTPDTKRRAGRISGFRSVTFVPLINDAQGIGTIILTHPQAGFRLSDKQLALVKTFADQAVIAIQNTRLFNETREALERQTATADILKVIASSPSDVQPVFDAIADRANRLIGGLSAAVFRYIDGQIHLAGFTPTDAAGDAVLQSSFPAPLDQFPPYQLTRQGAPAELPDTEIEPAARDIARARGYRSMLFAPLMNDGEAVGIITVTRVAPGPFGEQHVRLLQMFADQAVIAIKNVGLFNEVQARTEELSEALQQQTATADVLKVISRSAFDLETVLDALLSSACRLCDADIGTIRYREGGEFRLAATFGCKPEWIEHFQRYSTKPDRSSVFGRTIVEGHIVHIPDLLADPDYNRPEAQKLIGFRAALGVPLTREGEAFGVINLFRFNVSSFEIKQIELVQTFADQAVIAIENVRLFDEVQAKTRDLTEALTHQTASSSILGVIASSPTEVTPALQAIVESACKLCDAYDANVLLRIGDDLHYSAHHGPIPTGTHSRPINRQWATGRSVVDKVPVQVPDFWAPKAAEFPEGQQQSREQGHRCTLSVPLLREGEALGALVLRRLEPVAFSDKQIALLQTFADQAVIAIGNVRLFDEVQAKTRDLSEALTYQTGSANILKVIASSPTDINPVLNAIVESACELCGAYDALVRLRDGDDLVFSAHHGPIPTTQIRHPITRSWTAGAAMLDGKAIHISDLLSPEGDQFPETQDRARQFGHRTILTVPLLREGVSIGVIILRRMEMNPFTDKQVGLLQTFADQAVIAIGNVRLFEEVQARTRDLTESLQQQTATSEVLEVISASAGDLEPVFQKMLANAIQVCGAEFGSMNLTENGGLRPAAQYNVPTEYAAARGDRVFTPHPTSPLAISIRTRQVVHWADLRTTESYLERYPAAVQLVELAGARTVAIVPMLRDDEVVGAITIFRKEVQLFSDKQVELLSNFAKQAVIAIENARLLKELRQRTTDLSKSLEDLRTAQGRLIQTEKLASLGQLTAGIAHEIKNPLNFVNNFAALSADLTDELNDVLKPAEIADKLRTEVDELTRLLKGNLEKIVQHGKRADSIVKNMLLHSREGSGEQRPADINGLVEESLNLAYHGARAERPDFNVTLQRDFDPAAGEIEVFPQEISRVFLNLVSNGFYAVTKRRKEHGEPGFEPTLRASTKDLGVSVEIRIRDNGIGIPPEVKEKMFNPFFTTKPAGEGTGLGLSMSHDIIVKQHGGTIDVDSEPGHFTEFRIVLPRASNSSEKSRGQT